MQANGIVGLRYAHPPCIALSEIIVAVRSYRASFLGGIQCRSYKETADRPHGAFAWQTIRLPLLR